EARRLRGQAIVARRELAPSVGDARLVRDVDARFADADALAQVREEEHAHRHGVPLRPRSPTTCPSAGRINFVRASVQAAGDPGSTATNVSSMTPAVARLRNAAGPISAKLNARKISPKPGSSFVQRSRRLSMVTSRGAMPVPPVTRTTATVGSATAVATAARIAGASSGTIVA